VVWEKMEEYIRLKVDGHMRPEHFIKLPDEGVKNYCYCSIVDVERPGSSRLGPKVAARDCTCIIDGRRAWVGYLQIDPLMAPKVMHKH